MRIAYAGFDLFYPALKILLDDGHDIIKIYSCRTDNVSEFNTEVTSLAREIGIPITYDRITSDDLAELWEAGCEALITAGYYYRVPIDGRLRMVNIHPALLPVGRGAWPMPVTILRGIGKSGVTIHKMEETFDTGDILMQREFDVAKNEDLISFMNKVYGLLPDMLEELCGDFDKYYDNAVPQGEGEYWECPDTADYVITESTSVEDADLILRAFMGFECIYKTGDKTYALQYGRAVKGESAGKKFPVDGGYIFAKNMRDTLCL